MFQIVIGRHQVWEIISYFHKLSLANFELWLST